MACHRCRVHLPPAATVCGACGSVQATGRHAVAEDGLWEHCEIRARWLGAASERGGPAQSWFQFEVAAVGPGGPYVVHTTGPFRAAHRPTPTADGYLPREEWNQLVVNLVHAVVAQLQADQWTPLPQGAYWFSHRFQRRVGGAGRAAPAPGRLLYLRPRGARRATRPDGQDGA